MLKPFLGFLSIQQDSSQHKNHKNTTVMMKDHWIQWKSGEKTHRLDVNKNTCKWLDKLTFPSTGEWVSLPPGFLWLPSTKYHWLCFSVPSHIHLITLVSVSSLGSERIFGSQNSLTTSPRAPGFVKWPRLFLTYFFDRPQFGMIGIISYFKTYSLWWTPCVFF